MLKALGRICSWTKQKQNITKKKKKKRKKKEKRRRRGRKVYVQMLYGHFEAPGKGRGRRILSWRPAWATERDSCLLLCAYIQEAANPGLVPL
jgi:hypothetical protein